MVPFFGENERGNRHGLWKNFSWLLLAEMESMECHTLFWKYFSSYVSVYFNCFFSIVGVIHFEG